MGDIPVLKAGSKAGLGSSPKKGLNGTGEIAGSVLTGSTRGLRFGEILYGLKPI